MKTKEGGPCMMRGVNVQYSNYVPHTLFKQTTFRHIPDFVVLQITRKTSPQNIYNGILNTKYELEFKPTISLQFVTKLARKEPKQPKQPKQQHEVTSCTFKLIGFLVYENSHYLTFSKIAGAWFQVDDNTTHLVDLGTIASIFSKKAVIVMYDKDIEELPASCERILDVDITKYYRLRHDPLIYESVHSFIDFSKDVLPQPFLQKTIVVPFLEELQELQDQCKGRQECEDFVVFHRSKASEADKRRKTVEQWVLDKDLEKWEKVEVSVCIPGSCWYRGENEGIGLEPQIRRNTSIYILVGLTTTEKRVQKELLEPIDNLIWFLDTTEAADAPRFFRTNKEGLLMWKTLPDLVKGKKAQISSAFYSKASVDVADESTVLHADLQHGLQSLRSQKRLRAANSIVGGRALNILLKDVLENDWCVVTYDGGGGLLRIR
jgi:hypothetical protein